MRPTILNNWSLFTPRTLKVSRVKETSTMPRLLHSHDDDGNHQKLFLAKLSLSTCKFAKLRK